jgi:hypothetical protein
LGRGKRKRNIREARERLAKVKIKKGDVEFSATCFEDAEVGLLTVVLAS